MAEPTLAPADTPPDQLLTQRYADHIAGTLGCWDRVLLTGTLTKVCHAGAVRVGCAGIISAVSI